MDFMKHFQRIGHMLNQTGAKNAIEGPGRKGQAHRISLCDKHFPRQTTWGRKI